MSTTDGGVRVSIRPTEFIDRRVLDANSEGELTRVGEMTLDEVIEQFIAPVADDKSYFDLRGAPVVWKECADMTSAPHLFLHALCLASQDDRLKELADVRRKAIALCSMVGDEMGLAWLKSRPAFSLDRMVPDRSKRHFNSWSWQMRVRMSGLADQYSSTMRVIYIVYSSKSLLGSQVKLQGWREVLKRDIVDAWEAWLTEETVKVHRLFKV